MLNSAIHPKLTKRFTSPHISIMVNERKIFNVLVIEDNYGDFTLVEEFLTDQIEDFALIHAKNFKEAKDYLISGTHKFDIVLLDLSLPDKTGIPLILEVVEISSNIPIVVLTGYADNSFGVKSLSMGVSDYILKEDLTSSMLYKSIIYSCERKKATLALEDSEKQYSEMFHLSPQPMWVFDKDTLEFLDVNNAATKHYGYSTDEFLSMTLNDLSVKDSEQKVHGIVTPGIDKLKLYPQGIFIHKKKNSDFIQVAIESNNIHFKGKSAIINLANDITERLNYINAIETQNQKLREIAWIQSHLVRAPVARILGLVNIINDLKDNVDEKEKMLQFLLLSARELDDVIKDITEITTVPNNKFELEHACSELRA